MNISVLIKALPAILLLNLFIPIHPVAAQKATTAPIAAKPARQESTYDYQMRLGYAAAQRKDYKKASIRFKNALYARPNDRYATIAYYNMIDVLNGNKPKNRKNSVSVYERQMRIGYSATDKKDFQTALINFRRALKTRPNDPYATQAIRNVSTYIERGDR